MVKWTVKARTAGAQVCENHGSSLLRNSLGKHSRGCGAGIECGIAGYAPDDCVVDWIAGHKIETEGTPKRARALSPIRLTSVTPPERALAGEPAIG